MMFSDQFHVLQKCISITTARQAYTKSVVSSKMPNQK